MNRVAVIGSRDFDDYEMMRKVLDEYKISLIVSGGAYGADKLGELYAKENDIETLIFLPEWNKYGKRAGYIRNKDIVENSDIVIAFWNGVSRGTRSSIKIAKTIGVRYRIVYSY